MKTIILVAAAPPCFATLPFQAPTLLLPARQAQAKQVKIKGLSKEAINNNITLDLLEELLAS
jgi:hypothetical protein